MSSRLAKSARAGSIPVIRSKARVHASVQGFDYPRGTARFRVVPGRRTGLALISRCAVERVDDARIFRGELVDRLVFNVGSHDPSIR